MDALEFETVDTIPGVNGYIARTVEAFLASGASMVRLRTDYEKVQQAHRCVASLLVRIKHHGWPVRVVRRGVDVYLVRTAGKETLRETVVRVVEAP